MHHYTKPSAYVNTYLRKQPDPSPRLLQKQTEVDLQKHLGLHLEKKAALHPLLKWQDNSSVHSASNHPLQSQVSHPFVSPQSEPGYSSAPPLSAHFHYLSQEEVEGVETFIFFIGYGRSGHSIVASMMDAHPSIIIAHEYYLFDKLAVQQTSALLQMKGKLFNALYFNSYISATKGFRTSKHTSKGYNLNLNGTWQGQFQKLRVIGDKTAGSTAMMYYKSATLFKKTLQNLQDVVGVPLHEVHVVRNPYDMIATVALYQASGDADHKKVNASVGNPFNSSFYITLAADIVLNKALAVVGMVRDYNFHPLEIHLEDLIKDPRSIVIKIGQFIGVPCTEEYVKSCQNKVYQHAFRSRELVVWPRIVLEKVQAAIKEIAFFNRYSFSGE